MEILDVFRVLPPPPAELLEVQFHYAVLDCLIEAMRVMYRKYCMPVMQDDYTDVVG